MAAQWYGLTDTGLWVSPGRPNLGASRDDLVMGTYEPDETTTGLLPGWTVDMLDEYNSPTADSVTIPDGAVLENKIIYGDITHAGAGEGHNCYLRGGTQQVAPGNLGVLSCNNTRTGIFKWYDTRIEPFAPGDGRDGALGRQFELYRCHITGGVDGVGAYSTSSTHQSADVVVQQCLIETLTYVYPDQDHTDGTHNDCVQIQSMKGVKILGNSLRGTSVPLAGTGTNPDKPWLIGEGYANGSCVIVSDALGWGSDGTVDIEYNYMRGGLAHLNIKATAGAFTYAHNRHHRETATNASPAWAGYWIRGDQQSASGSITGLTTGTNDNRWLDGPYTGDVLVAPRDLGIQWDA